MLAVQLRAYFCRTITLCCCVPVACRAPQVVPGLILYSQVFRPGKAKIMLHGAQLRTDPTNDRVFVVVEPAHADPNKKGKINPQKEHRFQAPNQASRDVWLRAINTAITTFQPTGAAAVIGGGGGGGGGGGAAGTIPQGAPLAPGFGGNAPAPAGPAPIRSSGVAARTTTTARPPSTAVATRSTSPPPKYQRMMLIIPPGVSPGMSFMFRAMGQTFSSTCPAGKGPGDQLQVR